jgi:hypothetical protein
MATDVSVQSTDLAEFHLFVGDCLRNDPRMTSSDAWEQWQSRAGSADYEASVAGLRRSLAEADAGQVISWQEVDRELRTKHNLSSH